MVIKVSYTYNGVFNDSEFMKEIFNNYQKINLSGASNSHKNGSPEHTINTMTTMAKKVLTNDALICTKENVSTGFDQWRWTTTYGSTIRYLACSMVYLLLRHVQ